MIGLKVKADYVIQGDGEPSSEAKKLEDALKEFFKYYRADSVEVLGYQFEFIGTEVS